MNRQETSRILAVLRAVWTNTAIDANTVTAYQMALADVDYETVSIATTQYIKTGKFFPRPAELLEIIATATVANDLVPETAWAEVLREAHRCGYNRMPEYRNGAFIEPPKPEFSHPLIAEAVEGVGWVEICMTPEDKISYVRDSFVKTLKALTDRAIKGAQIHGTPDALTGGTGPVGIGERAA